MCCRCVAGVLKVCCGVLHLPDDPIECRDVPHESIVSMCCSVLLCVAVCCSCGAVCCRCAAGVLHLPDDPFPRLDFSHESCATAC